MKNSQKVWRFNQNTSFSKTFCNFALACWIRGEVCGSQGQAGWTDLWCETCEELVAEKYMLAYIQLKNEPKCINHQ